MARLLHWASIQIKTADQTVQHECNDFTTMRQVYPKLPADAREETEFNKRKFPFCLFPSSYRGEEEWLALAALTNITSCLISGDNGGEGGATFFGVSH